MRLIAESVAGGACNFPGKRKLNPTNRFMHGEHGDIQATLKVENTKETESTAVFLMTNDKRQTSSHE